MMKLEFIIECIIKKDKIKKKKRDFAASADCVGRKVGLGFKMKLELNALAAGMKHSQATESSQRVDTHGNIKKKENENIT